MVQRKSCKNRKNLKGGDHCGSHVMAGGDSTPYIKLDLSEQNSVLAGSYAPVSQGLHQCGGAKKQQRKSRKQKQQKKKQQKKQKTQKRRTQKKQQQKRKQQKKQQKKN